MSQFLISMPHGFEWLLFAFVVAGVIFWIKVLVQILNTKFEDNISKGITFIVVFILGFVGAFVYVLFANKSYGNNYK